MLSPPLNWGTPNNADRPPKDSSGSESSFCRRFLGGGVGRARTGVAAAEKAKIPAVICGQGN